MPVDHGVRRRSLLLGDHGAHGLARELDPVGVIVDLADAGVDGLSVVVVRDARTAVHDERNAHAAADLGEDVEVEVRLALVDAVDGSEGAGEKVEARLVDEVPGLVGIGVGRTGLLGGAALVAGARLAGAHRPELALEAGAEARAHVGGAPRVGDVLLVGKEGPVEHGAREAQLEGTAHVGEVLAVVEMHADQSARALGELDERGPQVVERRERVVALGVREDHGQAGLLGGVERRPRGLEARGVERCDRHVVLLGDGADVR